MAGLSDYLAQSVLNFVTSNSPMPALASRYLALFTAAPTADAVGSPSNTTSLQTGEANAAVSQLVGGMVAGVTYRLQCVAGTSDGQSLSLWTHLTCQAPA